MARGLWALTEHLDDFKVDASAIEVLVFDIVHLNCALQPVNKVLVGADLH